MTETADAPEPATAPGRPRTSRVQRVLMWSITLVCFGFLYTRISGAAGDDSVLDYLGEVFASVSWGRWLVLMVPYSILFFLVDTLVLWRVVNWFNARIGYLHLLPVRASTYILSIVNEQVGKGAMAVYLTRRHDVPGWQVGSSMLFIMFCEFYYLLAWATLGYWLTGDTLPGAFALIPWIAAGAAVFFVAWVLFWQGRLLKASALREREIFHAFRQATPLHYLGVVILRSPALLAAVVVYSKALSLFGVEASLLEMLGVLPVIFFSAAIPTPMRAAAITLWVELFPDHPAQMASFGIVQHNFFILFNAAIGLLFLRRANRELFGSRPPSSAP